MEPVPINPNPPALLTADASSHPLHQIIPPWMMGYLMLKREVMVVFMVVFYLLRVI
jgi:hypothetical protein